MPRVVVAALAACLFSAGCAGAGEFLPGLKSPARDWTVQNIHSTGRVGPDIRETDSGTNNNRWTAQTGFEATTYNGHKFGLEYRRRDTDNGIGNNDGHDDSVWLTWSVPVWKDTSRPNKEKQKEKQLEQRIAALEKRLADQNPPPVPIEQEPRPDEQQP